MLLLDPSHQMIRGVAALVAFAVVYGLLTLALGVPEARALAARAYRR